MNENTNFKQDLIAKWLQVLMYTTIVSVVNSVINFLPIVPSSVTTWVSRGIMAAVVVCMFRLAPANDRYRKVGIMRAVMLVCTLITAFLFASFALTLAASILSVIAVYQEYSGHAELISEKDAKLSGKWHSLFTWGSIAAVLVSFGSTVAVLIVSVLEADAVRITGMIVGLLTVPQLVIDVMYLLYLKKMIGYFRNGADVYGNAV